MPKISVIMAAYNAASYIGQALDSLLAQTFHDMEIILVDDRSTDATLAIMKEYAQKDGRIRVLEHKAAAIGGGAARNLGMSAAYGDYFSILDADDIFEPDMLAHAYGKAQETEAEIVMFDGDIFDDSRQERQPCHFILRHPNLPDEQVFMPQAYSGRIFQMSIGAAWNLLIKSDLIAREELRFESLHNSNDTTFTLLALALAGRIAVLDEKLILYRRYHRYGSGIHTNKNKWPLDVCEALWRVRCGLEQRGIYDLYRIGFVRRALELVLLYLRRLGSDWPTFVDMYKGLQQKYAELLDFASLAEAKIGDPNTAAQRCLLRDCTPEVFASVILRDVQISSEAETVPEGARIAIYGAGDKGADFFHHVYRAKKWHIAAWVDRDYERLGWPLVSPGEMLTAQPDYVLIAIENRKTCVAVKRDLIHLGLAPEIILPALPPERELIL